MEKQEMDSGTDLITSRKVLEMLTVANDFCLFLEKAEDYSREEILLYLQKVCPLLYLKASLLPEIEVENDEATEHFVTEELWENMFNILRQKFGNDDIYYFIDHHVRNTVEAEKSSIAENITDIYQDMKDFVLLYQKPLLTSKENAIRDCKNMFETRFGYRLVNVHSILHYLLFHEGEKGELQDILETL
ncbi:MAG: DUF5063 domain-containing protein [Bacteroidota bacterium]|nr:DUF5063 domain-containing protein [Bacteroidota bacterium]